MTAGADRWPMRLSEARILLSNDDGIDAPGLAVLERIAAGLSPDIWIVAPETEQSGAGHSLTLHRPLRIRQIDDRRFAVDGTPTDCVLLAVNRILADKKPTLLLSGVNRGANLGEDVTYSGTVAAAMEGTLLGVPSIAFSQLVDRETPPHWETAETLAGDVLRRLVARGWPETVLINVNFPHCPPDAAGGIEVTCQGRHKLGDNIVEGRDPRGRPYYWIGAVRSTDNNNAATDLCCVERGAISVTPLHLDLTHAATIADLKGHLS